MPRNYLSYKMMYKLRVDYRTGPLLKPDSTNISVLQVLKLYRSHIRSKLDYGSVVYGSARASYLVPLNCVHALRHSKCSLNVVPTSIFNVH